MVPSKISKEYYFSNSFIKEVEYSQRISTNYSFFRLLKHKNIIHIYKIVRDENKTIYFLEKFNGDALNFTYPNKKKAILALIDVIYFLSSKRILHMDIRPPNILTNKKSIKLIDVDYCNYVDLIKKPICGGMFSAPELRINKPHRYSDFYSVGMVCAYLMIGGEFYDIVKKRNFTRVLIKRLREEYGSNNFLKCVSKFLNKNPGRRYVSKEYVKNALMEIKL